MAMPASERVPIQPPPEIPEAGELLSVLTAFKNGDFSVRMPLDRTGMAGKIADTLNGAIDMADRLDREIERATNLVGKEGRLTRRASLEGALGGWAATIDSVNSLIEDFVTPRNEMARVIGAVAKGDLAQTMSYEVEGRALQGEFL